MKKIITTLLIGTVIFTAFPAVAATTNSYGAIKSTTWAVMNPPTSPQLT